MNKISKKIVALATMAAFVLTLVPAAAFAAPADQTGYTVSEATAANYNKTTVNITLSDEDVADLNGTDGTNSGNIVVWAEKVAGTVASDVTYGNNVDTWGDLNASAPASVQDMGVVTGTFANNLSVDLTFATPGDYKVYVALNKEGNFEDYAMAKAAATAKDFHAYGAADANRSEYGVIENGAVKAEVDATVDKEITTNFVVRDGAGNATIDTLATDGATNYIVWAEKDGKPTNYVKFNGVTPTAAKNGISLKDLTPAVKVISSDKNACEIKVAFTQSGDYKLYVGVGNTVPDAQYKPLVGTTTVHVANKNVEVDSLQVSANTTNREDANKAPVAISFDSNDMGKLDLTQIDPDFDYDGIDDIILTGKVLDENGYGIQGKEVTLTTNKDAVAEIDGNSKTVTTNQYGEFTVSFDMQDKSNVTLYLINEEEGIDYSINVIAAKTSATNIDRTKTGGYVLAGNDKTYGDATYKDKTSVNFTDAVQFEVTDQKNEPVTGNDAIKGYKLELRAKSNDDSKLKSDDLNLVWDADNGVYTLAYVGRNAYAEDLVPGKYEVRVALPSGDNATVTFNVAKFGKVQDTVLDIHAHDADMWNPANPNAYTINVDDQITLGQFVSVNAVYVDENGIKVDAPDVNYGFNGDAVRDIDVENGTFVTPADSAVNDSLIGTEIEVIAYNTANKQLVTKTLTVVKSYTDKTLEFGSEQGPIAKDNKVPVSVVNEDGKVQQVKGTITAWVADQSNEDAKVSVDTTNATVNSGKGSITVYSDEETTADIVVIVKAGTEVYPATLHYTFGAEDPLANRTVVMTIDSTEYVVNNNVFTGDAAPYIDSNWRTMVPIRALMEAFDSEVIWNQDDETVTINFDGDTQIVMTVGETGYTIDGVDGDMDTVPVNTGSRVYVPIRFVAEGIGFHVTPLYNADGLTASVVFQK